MKDQPTLLVLGASEDQRFAIESAKNMGCYVIAADRNPNATAFDSADEKVITCTQDIDGLIEFVHRYQKNKNIDGVMTMGSEIPMSIAILSEVIESPGISRNTAKLASNKLEMKNLWADKQVPIPWYSEVRSSEHLKDIVKEFGWDLIVKPTDRSGARGITILSDKMNLVHVFEKARSISYEGKVLVEELLPGPQLSTESIVYDDFFTTAGFSDRNYDMTEMINGSPIENGGTMPSVINQNKLTEVHKLLEKAARTLGIERGVAKGDVAFDKYGNPKMIEMAARLSGGWMSSGLIPVTTGVNIVETIIEISLGVKPDLNKLVPKWQKHAALRYFFPNPGQYKTTKNINKVQNQSWVKVLEFYKTKNDYINLPMSHGDRFGAFLVEANSRNEVINRANWVYNTIRIITG